MLNKRALSNKGALWNKGELLSKGALWKKAAYCFVPKKTQQKKRIRPDKTPCDNDRRRIRPDKVLAREGSHSVTWPIAWSGNPAKAYPHKAPG